MVKSEAWRASIHVTLFENLRMRPKSFKLEKRKNTEKCDTSQEIPKFWDSIKSFQVAILHPLKQWMLKLYQHNNLHNTLLCCIPGGSLEPAVTSLESLQGCYDFLWNSAGLMAFIHHSSCKCVTTVVIIFHNSLEMSSDYNLDRSTWHLQLESFVHVPFFFLNGLKLFCFT